MFDIWRLLFSVRECDLECAAAKASSWNGFGCVRYFVRPLQVLVRVWTTRALAWPGVRWHVKLRQEGPYLMASGAIAYNKYISDTQAFQNGYFQNIRAKTAPINRAKIDHWIAVKTPNPVLIFLFTVIGTVILTVSASQFPDMNTESPGSFIYLILSLSFSR